MNLKKIQQEIVQFRNQRNWKQFHNPKDFGLGLMCEAAEFAEHFKYYQGEELKDYIQKHKEDISDELIDVLFWVLLAAHDLDIDLEQSFKRKMKKNAQKYPDGSSHKNYR